MAENLIVKFFATFFILTEYYGTLAYFVTDTLLDLIMSLIYATSIAIISYYMTNQPRQTDRFIAYLTAWYLIMLIFNALGHVFTLIFYPYSSLCLLIGIFNASQYNDVVEFHNSEKRTNISIYTDVRHSIQYAHAQCTGYYTIWPGQMSWSYYIT